MTREYDYTNLFEKANKEIDDKTLESIISDERNRIVNELMNKVAE